MRDSARELYTALEILLCVSAFVEGHAAWHARNIARHVMARASGTKPRDPDPALLAFLDMLESRHPQVRS